MPDLTFENIFVVEKNIPRYYSHRMEEEKLKIYWHCQPDDSDHTMLDMKMYTVPAFYEEPINSVTKLMLREYRQLISDEITKIYS
jgi:hypothetical protein